MKSILLLLITFTTCTEAAKGSCQYSVTPKANPLPKPIVIEKDDEIFRPNTQVFSNHFEFLYWKTVENSLIYAQKMNQPNWGPANDGAIGTFQTSKFNIEPGFRVSQSFFKASSYWEVWWSYTRLTAHGTNHAEKPSPTDVYLTSAWPAPFTSALSNARSSLGLNYNVADIYFDRYFNPNPHLRLRVLAGITGTWMSQNWTIKYFDIDNHTNRLRSTWNFWGCGIRVGTTADWYWTHNIYLTVKGTLAGLMGPYHNRTKLTTNILQSGYNSTLPIINTGYRDTRPIGHLQLLIGPSWQKNWTNVRTECFVGYEFNAWENLHEVYHSTIGSDFGYKETSINNGLIGLHGLTTRLTIDY
jgi:hypothetical protein